LETRFAATLNKLLRAVETAVNAARTPQEVITALTQYANSQAYKEWCNQLALTITTQINTGASATWREAARKAGRGSEIYNAIMAELKTPLAGVFSSKLSENAKLISTFPLEVAQTLNKRISEQALQGKRASEILQDLIKQYPNIAKSRLNMIARTEVSKTQTALIQGRSQQLGLDWYVWQTSQDSRVRTSHEHMQGVLVNWGDPPDPEALKGEKSYGAYHAGDTFYCRCYPEPIVNIDYIDFPADVHQNGIISKMTRSRFEQIM